MWIIISPCEGFWKLHQSPTLSCRCIHLCGCPLPSGLYLSSTKGKHPLEISGKEENEVKCLFPSFFSCWIVNGCGIMAMGSVTWPVSHSPPSSLGILATSHFPCSCKPRSENGSAIPIVGVFSLLVFISSAHTFCKWSLFNSFQLPTYSMLFLARTLTDTLPI